MNCYMKNAKLTAKDRAENYRDQVLLAYRQFGLEVISCRARRVHVRAIEQNSVTLGPGSQQL